MRTKSFGTLSGAARYRDEIGGVIIRISTGAARLYVVAPSFIDTTIQSVAPDGSCDGSISMVELTTRGRA